MLDLLKFHGVEISDKPRNNQHIGVCPFSDCGSDKLHVNVSRELWDCKKCGREGNKLTLITELHKDALSQTSGKHYKKLASQRPGTTAEALEAAQFAWDGYRWLVPYQNGSEFLNNLGAFNPNQSFKIFKSPGLPLKLYRPYDRKSFEETVVVTEGEWDLIALKPFLPAGHSIASVPGALTFKEEFIPDFRGKSVILIYDKDPTGKKGIAKAIKLLSPHTKSIKYMAWPNDLEFHDAGDKDKPGKDIRDLVVSMGN